MQGEFAKVLDWIDIHMPVWEKIQH
jgi:hypothetical protein